MVGTSIMTSMRRGRVCTSRTQLKKSVIFHTHMHIQSMRRFSNKTETDSNNTHEDGLGLDNIHRTSLFAISTIKSIENF